MICKEEEGSLPEDEPALPRPLLSHDQQPLYYLGAPLVGAAAAVGGAEAEAACAALGVGGVQVEGPDPALVTAGALHVLLQGATHSSQGRMGFV